MIHAMSYIELYMVYVAIVTWFNMKLSVCNNKAAKTDPKQGHERGRNCGIMRAISHLNSDR